MTRLFTTVRRYANEVQMVWAPYLPPLAVILHRGRRTGRAYRTPVLAWRFGDRIAVVLYYGEDVDWVRNVLAAGYGRVLRSGLSYTLTGPRLVDADDEGLGLILRGLALPASTVLMADIDEGTPDDGSHVDGDR